MKKVKGILMIISCLVFRFVHAQPAEKSGEFLIQARLEGLKDGTPIYLVKNKNEVADTISRTKAINQKFIFKGSVSNGAEPYFIKFDTVDMKYDIPIKKYIRLIVENTKMFIDGSVHNFDDSILRVSGSISHSEYIESRRISGTFVDELNEILRQRQMALKTRDSSLIETLRKEETGLRQRYKKSISQWIKNHRNSLIVGRVVLTNSTDDLELEIGYNLLSQKAKNCFFGLQLKEEIETRRRTTVGSPAPNLVLFNPQNERISLQKVVDKSRATLLNFWASWCVPCRKEFVDLKKLYEKYNPQGLNILGVSIDENQDEWKKASLVDSILWYNVRDDNKMASKKYGITSVPAFYLLDSDGKIFFKGQLFNNELERKIEGLLGEKEK